MSRLSSISDSESGEIDAAYTYLGAGTIAVEDYAQSQVKLDYDPDGDDSFTGLDRFGRVVDQIWTDYGGDDAVIDHYQYEYDRAGNRSGKTSWWTNDSLDETYIYDNLDRLTDWYVGGSETPAESWNLDALGNNLGAGTYNAANEETPTQGSSGYDTAGNMITLQSGNSAIYDAWNRLVEVDDASQNILQRNVYDGTNRRIQVLTDFDVNGDPGTVSDDYFQGQQVVETRENSAVKYQYLWSPRYIDAPILRDTYHTVEGQRVINLDDRIFYLGDANYNVTGLVKYNAGTEVWEVVERYSYTPYGVVTVRAGDTWAAIAGNVSQENNTILYTGRTVDLATGGLQNVDLAAGLMYYRARFYDAVLERFINRDPARYAAGDFNLYRYCADDPINTIDASGLCAISHCCCCATKIEMPEEGELKLFGSSGSGFRFTVTLHRENKLWNEDHSSDCTFQWWELWKEYSGNQASLPAWYPPGVTNEEWVDFVHGARDAKLPADEDPFNHWTQREPGPCPGAAPPIAITDKTRLMKVFGKPTTRTIYFYIRLVSSCPEGKCRYPAVAACAKEVIRYSSTGAILERYLRRTACTPGIFPSFPPAAPPVGLEPSGD